MPKKQNDLCVVILFSIICIVRPILYDEMRMRHSIQPQENAAVINSSSIPTQNNKFELGQKNQ